MSESEKIPGDPNSEIGTLVNAFRYFNEAASSLNVAYRRLEDRIELLNKQIEEKDRELYSRLRELDRVTRYLSSLLESISSGVIAVDMDGNITIFNRTAAEMTNVVAETAIGKPYTEVMGEENQDLGAIYTLLNGPELRSVEKRLPGSSCQVEVGTTWVVDSLGERVGVVEVFEHISTLRRLQERYEHQKVLSAMGEMASAVAHEVRNPLAGIGGFAALLKEDLSDDPSKQRLVSKILQGVNDLDRVAGNLLFLTRRNEVRRENVDLKALLEDIVQLLEAEVHGKGLDVNITSHLPQEDIDISGDKELLKMILTNLGRNSIQALNDKGSVTFRLNWMLLANRVQLEVVDDGCGIELENISKLFNPFFTTRTEGTGLGLALVKKAIDLHKGHIDVVSKPGEGTKFRVELPIKPFTPALQETEKKDEIQEALPEPVTVNDRRDSSLLSE